jgi:hypothetical protein
VATRVGKVLPTALKVADQLADGAHIINSPAGKVIANTLPMVVTGGTAGVQALRGDTAGATTTLLNMGLPMLGNSGGKVLNGLSQNGGRVLSNLADISTSPTASRMMGNMGDLLNNRAVQNTLSATATGVSTLGMSAPTVISGCDV